MSSGALYELSLMAELMLQPAVLQPTITLQLSGWAVLVVFMAIGGYIGYLRGLRALLTVTLVSIIAYLICVRGGDQIIMVLNRFYTNILKLFAFAIGRSPTEAPLLDPLISGEVRVPLFFRFVLFIALVSFGWFFNKSPKWYSAAPNDKSEPLARILGIFTGAFIALMWSNAVTVFWQDFATTGGNLGAPINGILNILPDVSIFVPSLITIFFLVITVIVLFNLPKVWKS